MAFVIVALLARTGSVVVTEISRSGCLIESAKAIPEGSVGTLSVTVGDVAYVEDVRVARCQTVPGGGDRHYIGVEFLTLPREGRQSLRLYAASLGAAVDASRLATLA